MAPPRTPTVGLALAGFALAYALAPAGSRVAGDPPPAAGPDAPGIPGLLVRRVFNAASGAPPCTLRRRVRLPAVPAQGARLVGVDAAADGGPDPLPRDRGLWVHGASWVTRGGGPPWSFEAEVESLTTSATLEELRRGHPGWEVVVDPGAGR